MKRVLVAGAAGFLGSHLCKHHLESGDVVLGVDDFSSSIRGSVHLKDLLSYETFTFVEHNITVDGLDKFTESFCSRFGDLDLIYNFACPASPPQYQSMPIHTMLTCVVGTENLLRLAEHHEAILVHASTSEIYGDPDRSPQTEQYRGNVNCYGPRACYDEGKRAAEALCYDYLNRHHVDARLVRIFNTYGPHMDPYDGRVVSNFIRQALKGERLTIYGDGSQTRSFCYVDDLIRGIMTLGSLEKNPSTPINLGNPNEFTIFQLAELIVQKLNPGISRGVVANLDESLAHQVFSNLPVDDPRQRCPDITLAKKLLDWEPVVSLDVGLNMTIKYFRSVVNDCKLVIPDTFIACGEEGNFCSARCMEKGENDQEKKRLA